MGHTTVIRKDRKVSLYPGAHSSDPDNEDLKVLVYDCSYIPRQKGDFLPEFAAEYTGSYLIDLQKPSGERCIL